MNPAVVGEHVSVAHDGSCVDVECPGCGLYVSPEFQFGLHVSFEEVGHVDGFLEVEEFLLHVVRLLERAAITIIICAGGVV